jgi:enamine deaminase RidA (YjgF/YER057c/UK114 family)
MPANHWDWSMPVPFSQGWKTDGLIYVGGQISADAKGRTVGAGDIATQTRNVFEFIKAVLDEAGVDLSDIVKLNTYYQFEGEGEAITEFWEAMTEVRMEYLADPGPVGTAVRVRGFAFEDLSIEIEAIASVGQEKVRLMPADHWDWSMPVPFSQGWKVGDLIFLGGQVSADDRGRTVAPGDIGAQTRNVFKFIQRVLAEGGADLDDLVKLNTYYCYDGDEPTKFWEDMTRVRMDYIADPGPAATAVRVNGFAYEDLLIEIEGIAYTGADKQRLMPANHWDWSMPVKFSQGWRVGDLIFVGGQISADGKGRTIGAGDIATQTRKVFENIRKVLREAGVDMDRVVRLNTYYHFEGDGREITDFWEAMTKVRMEYLPDPGPVGTAVRVNGLAYEDLLIEIEAIAYVGP